MTPILGRDDAISQLCDMLDANETRLVTLTGPGGIGKTRLALEIARRLEGDFAHGACFVSVATVRDPELVPAVVAHALGLQESGDRPPAELIASALRDRHMLLALDNLEHVVGVAAPWLSDLLARCPRVKALVTSRVVLHVAGERRFLVEPLSLPGIQTDHPNERHLESAAVELFVQRARGVHSDFAIHDDNVETVHQICRELEGLPLAIELAAARVNVLSPTALRDRLTHQLTVLSGGGRDVPARHQTMANAIAWSYDLLSPAHQHLFRQLSVFVGGFSLDALEAVGAGRSGPPTIDLMSELVDHSLIRHVPAEGDEIRFEMLEVIREFGLDRLQEREETETARDAHAAWYLELAREADRAMEGAGQVAWLNRLELEHDNIRGALAWLTDRERIVEAQDLAGSLWFFFWIRGYFTEGRQRYEALLAHPKGVERTVARGKAIGGMGVIALSQGDPEVALAAFREAIAIFREQKEYRYQAWALLYLGGALNQIGRNDEADAACTESLQVAHSIGDAWGMAAPLCILGLVAANRGDTALAVSQMQECADLCRALGNSWGLSLCLGNLGLFALRAGEATEAEDYWLESLEVVNQLKAKRDLPLALVSLADVSRYHGDPVSAEEYLREALTVAREIGDVYTVGWSLLGLGQLATLAHDLVQSGDLLRESIETFLALGNENDLAQCVVSFADVAIAAGEMKRAARFVGAADAMLDRGGHVRLDILPDQHKDRLHAVVSALGEKRFQDAWNGGKALSRDEALAEAMAYQPEPANTTGAVTEPMMPGAGTGLSPRELDVLRLMANGLTNQEIADLLFLSSRTVAGHAANVLAKLDATSRTGAVAYAIRNGFA